MAEKRGDAFLVPANASYRQAVSNNRLLSGLLIFLLVVFVGREFFYYRHPDIVKEPVYIEFSTGANNFVTISRAGDDLTANDALVDASIRRYVVDRETVDKVTENIRYPRVMAMSAPSVASVFEDKYGGKNSPFRQPGVKRTILITDSSKLDTGIYQVVFKMTESVDGTARHSTQWVATIAYSFEKQKVTYNKRLLNPLGLFVTEYSLSPRRNG